MDEPRLRLVAIGGAGHNVSESISLAELTLTSPIGLTITQHAGTIIVPDGTSGTITLDLSAGDWQSPAACTDDFTLALSRPTVGQQFTVLLQQGASASVTWFGGISWMGSPYTAPAMPGTASAYLAATFKCIAAGTYLGWSLGASAD